jgi:hypothetical protein
MMPDRRACATSEPCPVEQTCPGALKVEVDWMCGANGSGFHPCERGAPYAHEMVFCTAACGQRFAYFQTSDPNLCEIASAGWSEVVEECATPRAGR